MENQKFQIIFLIVMLFIGVYFFKQGDLANTANISNVANVSETSDTVSDAVMTHEIKKEENQNSDKSQKSKYKVFAPTIPSDIKEVPVNPPVALSGKSKSEVYNIRKHYVKSSVFAKSGYEPSEQVFGSIESGKPWISANVCAEPQTGLLGISGPSEESRFINNPTMLVAIEYPFIVHYTDADNCSSSRAELIPRTIVYSPSKKEIIVEYFHLPFTTNKNASFYSFNGLNAVDMGYKYAYIDKSKSTYPVDFINSDNLSNSVHEFQNYLHVGGSCGRNGGCNNGSPRQGFAEFKSNATEYNYKNREIYIKLWKSHPNSPNDPADIVERIILKWS